MGYMKYTYNRNFFTTIDTEDKAYWLGFIAADGCVAKKLNSVRVDLKTVDVNHLEKLRNSVNGNQPIVLGHSGKSCYIDLNSQQIAQDLVKYGVVPNKSLVLDMNLDLIPDILVSHMIRGYFDGDGSLNCYSRPPYWYQEWELSFISTEIMLKKFQTLFNKPKKIYTCGNNFRFCYKSKADIKDVLEYMYNDAHIFLDRKYEKVLEFFKPSETTKEQPKG